jgi:hypothetical protein
MSAAVVLPLWALLLLVAATPIAGWAGARSGAKQAIALCSSHWECAMAKDEERKENTQNMTKQLEALHKQDPELFRRMNRAMKRALEDTGEHPAIPENARAKKDEEGQR